MNTCLLSIVIPTKNRYQYLRECLASLIRFDSNEYEVVVQDNSDDNREILPFLRELDSPKIRYFYSGEKLSQTENSDLAVAHSGGEYVCYIGDDDTVTDYLILLARGMKKNGVQACNLGMTRYDWPDVARGKEKRAFISMDQRALSIQGLNTLSVLEKALKIGLQEIKYLPRTYHAIISRHILNEVKQRSGSYFPGPSPDMANACACATVVREHFYVRFPIVISGTAYGSAAGMGRRGAHKGELKDAAQLSPDVEKTWDPKIPKKWIPQAIWAESGLKGLNAMHAYELVDKMDWLSLYGRILLRCPEYRHEVFPRIGTLPNLVRVLIRMFFDGMRYIIRESAKKMRVMRGTQVELWGAHSLLDAQKMTADFSEGKCPPALFARQLDEAFSKG